MKKFEVLLFGERVLMMHHIKIYFLLIAMTVSVSVVEGMQLNFNRILKNNCKELIKESKFYELKPILYKHHTSVDCVQWFSQYADSGHCWALYMLMRDKYIRNGKSHLEVAGDDLIFVLECIIKFIVRFDQDVACWKLFGQPTPVDLRMGLRTKIRDWFLPMIHAERKNEFDQAIVRVKKWFQNFPEGKHLSTESSEGLVDGFKSNIKSGSDLLSANSYLSDDQAKEKKLSAEKSFIDESNPILPSPICVRCMIWESPNTLSYIPAQDEWITACQNQHNKISFEQIRKEVLDSLLQEFSETGHARGFIESLSNEKSGYMATFSNYASVAGEYASPVLGAVFTSFFGGKPLFFS